MAKKKIQIKGLTIALEAIHEEKYVSLTDMARQSDKDEPRFLIMYWLKNQNTLEFLETWENIHNLDFLKGGHLATFKEKYLQNRNALTPQKWIKETNAIGLISKSGKGGGTFAHPDIALNFAYWLSPSFQVYLLKEFQRLKKEEAQRLSFEWHISKITDNIDEIRQLLDTIPGQLSKYQRIKHLLEEEE